MTDTPVLNDFYAVCDMQHREFFSSVMQDWRETGRPWTWLDGDIALCAHSAGRDIPIFRLHAGGGMRRARVILDSNLLAQRLGKEECDRLLASIRDIHGLKWSEMEGMLEIHDPANTSGPVHQQLRDVIVGLGVRLPNLLAP